MSLQNIQKLRKERGFTIVELLIVIVVIGILAAIVIVAYQNVVRNANNSNDKTNATQVAKVAEAVNASENSNGYPAGTTTATLKTSFNSTPTTKLPNNVNVIYRAAGATEPSFEDAELQARTRAYFVEVCAASPNNTGLTIYYPIRGDTNSVGEINVGEGCDS